MKGAEPSEGRRTRSQQGISGAANDAANVGSSGARVRRIVIFSLVSKMRVALVQNSRDGSREPEWDERAEWSARCGRVAEIKNGRMLALQLMSYRGLIHPRYC